jgi:adenosylcobinamide kinase/adenosylcobinamide-phosphate guanylyltransferase
VKLLVTGGSRSGKTAYALGRAEAAHPRRRYVATAEAFDDEMAARIRRHRAERGEGWSTVESPLGPEAHLAWEGVAVLDCLALWTSNLLLLEEGGAGGGGGALRNASPDPLGERIAEARARLVAAVRAAPNPVVIVTNEVGLGIVPDNALARRFRDELGWTNQALAAACDEVVLCVAGLPLRVK